MRLLFTWHGYAMLFFGSFYVFFYGSSHYMCGLSRRRAISRRNGGYRSDGVTNTTDLRQVERTIEDEENGEGGGAGFGRTDNIKVTPAMASIPIVIFRKPKIQDSTVSPECATSSNIADSTANMDQDYFKSERLNFQSSVETVEVLEDTIEIRDTTPTPGKSFNLADRDAHSDLSSRSSLEQQGKSSGEHKMEDSGDSHVINMELTNSGSHRNAINKTSSTPGVRSGASSSSLARTTDAPWMATIVPQDSPSTSFMPCATGQEILDTEGCIQPASSISVPATGSQQPPQPMRRDSLSNSSTNSTSASNNGKSNTSAAFRSRVCPKIPVDDYPTIVDEECAICLFNFEDGDELRHLYCNHFFHRGCVDRWLTKNPFCPKCKRGI
ncbi:hypothetical protein EDD21DRAFT_61054 [Dissophora ornata]|nr:hypothetical protein EDD21DRAFT_61054 [Dissophora ornata]